MAYEGAVCPVRKGGASGRTERGRARLGRVTGGALLAVCTLAGWGGGLHAQDGGGPAPEAPTGGTEVARAEAADAALLARALDRIESLAPVSSLLVSRGGEVVVERYYRGMRADRAVNLKSVSKTLLSPLIGIALEEGLIDGVDQPVAELLPQAFRGVEGTDKREITLHHLLSMSAGLESTSFGNYGSWVSSRNWVRDALLRPLECPPGRCWEYSTGNTHLLSAILTRVTGMSTRAYAQEKLFGPMGIRLPAWDRDPQGIYLGGNNMSLRPRDLLRFGELFLNAGRHEGRELVSWEWILASWRPLGTSPWNGHRYGYLWWIEDWGGERAVFAWGYGGQYLVLVPELDLAAVVTSSLDRRRRRHTRDLREFFDRYLIPAFAAAPQEQSPLSRIP